ncbi:MAG TPA: asparaginase domain-containing protein [Gammaproteobacteria bacterium]|nr:asparaginase domain-containing protein [Gammaproteobacteria bacterium]
MQAPASGDAAGPCARVAVFTTGGTLDKVYFDALSRYEVGTPVVTGILSEAGVTAPYTVTMLMQKDSLDLSDADRGAIRSAIEQADAKWILVTHGTDTMIETARVLTDIPGKTIVLTGALKPARFRDSDAVFNVAAAFVAVQILPPGAWIVMNGRVFDPARARKNRDANRFEESESGE